MIRVDEIFFTIFDVPVIILKRKSRIIPIRIEKGHSRIFYGNIFLGLEKCVVVQVLVQTAIIENNPA